MLSNFTTAADAAKEAREINIKESEEQWIQIKQRIRQEISKGNYNYTFSGTLRTDVRDKLKELGYKIQKASFNQMDGDETLISW